MHSPGRHIVPDARGKFIVLPNIVNTRSCLVAKETTFLLSASSTRTFQLFFLEEADIDAVATKKESVDHSGRAKASFMEEFMHPLLQPHLHAANNRLPKDQPLPEIHRYRAFMLAPIFPETPSKDAQKNVAVSDSPASDLSTTFSSPLYVTTASHLLTCKIYVGKALRPAK